MIVFSRKTDDTLASLVKQIDKVVAQHDDKKMASFVNFLGEDKDKLESSVKDFSEKHKVENVALVVPVEHQHGPKSFKVAEEADVTVMLYKGRKVQANHAIKGPVSEEKIKAIVADVDKIAQ